MENFSEHKIQNDDAGIAEVRELSDAELTSRIGAKNLGQKAIEESARDTHEALMAPQTEELLEQAGQYVPAAMKSSIETRMAEIVDIMQNLTIGEKPSDKLTLTERKDIARLYDSGIGEVALSMTPEEVSKIANYTRTDTPEVEIDKTRKIHAVIARTINGVGERRDYRDNPEKNLRLLDLNAKFERWEHGEYDGMLYDEEELLASIDDKFDREEIFRDLRNLEDDPDDVLEYLGGIDCSEYLFACGPYTEKDLDDISDFARPVWVSPINPKLLGKKLKALQVVDSAAISEAEKDIFEETEGSGQSLALPMHEINDVIISLVGVDGCGFGDTIKDNLNNSFAVTEFVKNRSLGARNGIGLAAGYARAILDSFPEVKKAPIVDKNEYGDDTNILANLRRRLDLISKYAVRICGFSDKYLKKTYNSTRPVSDEFFAQCIDEAQSWTDEMAKQKDSDYLSDIFNMSLWTEVARQEAENYAKNREN